VAEIGARQLRHAEHVPLEGETLLRVGDANGDMVYTGWLHRSILPRIVHSWMRSGTALPYCGRPHQWSPCERNHREIISVHIDYISVYFLLLPA